jgi:quercetin dioxygenase-like cupin family protein
MARHLTDPDIDRRCSETSTTSRRSARCGLGSGHCHAGFLQREVTLAGAPRSQTMTSSVHSNSELTANLLPGLAHRTLAGHAHGLRGLEVWSQAIDPGGGTPPHRHDCEEVVVVLAGEGTLYQSGTAQAFGTGDTLILPANELHQIVNSGRVPLRVLAVLGMTPVRVELPDGTPIVLPWDVPLPADAR